MDSEKVVFTRTISRTYLKPILRRIRTISRKMFCLQGIGENNSDDQSEREDDFGWWLGDRRESRGSLAGKRDELCEFRGSSVSLQSCVDSDDPDSYVLDFAKREDNRLEPRSPTPAGILDVNLIEKDAQETKPATFTLAITRTDCNGCTTSQAEINEARRLEGACYTPERLVKSREYRILAPQPRYLCVSITRNPENEKPLERSARCSRKLDYIDGDTTPNAQTSVLDTRSAKVSSRGSSDGRNASCLDRITPEGKKEASFLARIRGRRRSALSTNDESNYTRRENGFVENSTKPREGPSRRRSLLLDGTSVSRWSDWSSAAHRDARTDANRLCLCDELAMAGRNDKQSEPKPYGYLQREPEPLDLTLEEDRFGRVSSTHDSLTRLALAIETDGSVSDINNKAEDFVRQLRDKLDELRVDSEDIHRDVTSLRKDFQRDEERLTNLLSEASKLRQGVDEVRYLDDLLKLLEGEVDRISQRNWPFMLGRSEFHPEEINLVV